MQKTPFTDFACSVARSLDVIGEWWTPLILRDLFLGLGRFEDLQRDLDIPRNVLAARLKTLVDHGVVVKVPYRDGRIRHAYELTEKGRDFVTTLIALMDWGDRWMTPAGGPPLRPIHAGCGGAVQARAVCRDCGASVDSSQITCVAGPGTRPVRGTSLVARAILEG